MGKYTKHWEMTEGGPYDAGDEVFACTDCGGVTHPGEGWNGEPDLNQCKEHCGSRRDKGIVSGANERFRESYARTFPDSPGANI